MNIEEQFIAYLREQKLSCRKTEKQLLIDERKDEANFCRIEANIYDIFEILFQTAVDETEKNGGDFAKAEAVFLAKAKAVPSNWKKSYEAAKEHQDAGKILIEETKLSVAAKIMEEYRREQGIKE